MDTNTASIGSNAPEGQEKKRGADKVQRSVQQEATAACDEFASLGDLTITAEEERRIVQSEKKAKYMKSPPGSIGKCMPSNVEEPTLIGKSASAVGKVLLDVVVPATEERRSDLVGGDVARNGAAAEVVAESTMANDDGSKSSESSPDAGVESGKKKPAVLKKPPTTLPGQTKMSTYFKPKGVVMVGDAGKTGGIFREPRGVAAASLSFGGMVDLVENSSDDDSVVVTATSPARSNTDDSLKPMVSEESPEGSREGSAFQRVWRLSASSRAMIKHYNADDEREMNGRLFEKAMEVVRTRDDYMTVIEQSSNIPLALSLLGLYDGPVEVGCDDEYNKVIKANMEQGRINRIRMVYRHPYKPPRTMAFEPFSTVHNVRPPYSASAKKKSLKSCVTGIGLTQADNEAVKIGRKKQPPTPLTTPKDDGSKKLAKKLASSAFADQPSVAVTKLSIAEQDYLQQSFLNARDCWMNSDSGLAKSSSVFHQIEKVHGILMASEGFNKEKLHEELNELHELCVDQGFMPRGVPDEDTEVHFKRSWTNTLNGYAIGDSRGFMKYLHESMLWAFTDDKSESDSVAPRYTGDKGNDNDCDSDNDKKMPANDMLTTPQTKKRSLDDEIVDV